MDTPVEYVGGAEDGQRTFSPVLSSEHRIPTASKIVFSRYERRGEKMVFAGYVESAPGARILHASPLKPR